MAGSNCLREHHVKPESGKDSTSGVTEALGNLGIQQDSVAIP